jgi:cytoskeletal protein CcmA (bactofilin family)
MNPAEGSTIIGTNVTIKGELKGEGEMFFDGNLEGAITVPDCRLTLGPNARVRAELNAGDVIIYGNHDGKINAAGRLELRDRAVVKGEIVADRISIDENANLKGKVQLTDSGRPSSAA